MQDYGTCGPTPPRRPSDRSPAVSPAGLKIVIAGGFGVGKTTFVGAISEIEPLTTEEYLTAASAPTDSLDQVESKETTTVAMDFGRITFDVPVVPIPVELFLFGTPGQERFLHTWHSLAHGAIGAVVLADTRRLDASFTAVAYFEQLALPFVVAVNQFPRAHRYSADEIRQALVLDPGVPVISCDARNGTSAASVLMTLVEHARSARFTEPAVLDMRP